jgi:hypothetical protein
MLEPNREKSDIFFKRKVKICQLEKFKKNTHFFSHLRKNKKKLAIKILKNKKNKVTSNVLEPYW